MLKIKKMGKIEQVKIPVSIGRLVRLTKLSDDAFEGNHPNGINEGYVKEGIEKYPPEHGQRYGLITGKQIWDYFSTSPVVTLPDENGVFKTQYSTYKLEYLD